jgi:transposase
VRLRTRVKNRIHGTLSRHNVQVPGADLFGARSRLELGTRLPELPLHSREAVEQELKTLDFLEEQIESAEKRLEATMKVSAEADLLKTLPYRAMEDRGQLTARVVVALATDEQKGEEQVADLVEKRRKFSGKRVRATSAKIFADGAIETGTAALLSRWRRGKACVRAGTARQAGYTSRQRGISGSHARDGRPRDTNRARRI